MSKTRIFQIPGFPVVHLAEDGARIDIRPVEPTDKVALRQFFATLPDTDRFYLKDDVSDPLVVDQWLDNLDYRRAIPFLGCDEDRIIAEGILHHRRAGARRHVAEVRIVVDPEYRNRGIGRGLLHKLAEVAYQQDIQLLLFEIVADVEEAARHAALSIGFAPVATLAGHIRDSEGVAHDLVIMEMNVQEQFPLRPNLF